MTGLGFVCFAIVLVGGSLLLTWVTTLLAMRQASWEELTAQKARLERANRRQLTDLAQRPRNAAALDVAD